MSKTARHSHSKVDHYGRRQPRPARRRTGTRHNVIAAAIREG